jgi:hypothetical protein
MAHHIFQLESELNVAGRKDRVRYLGKYNDRISYEVFTIFSGNAVAPARHLAEVKPSGRHSIAYRKQSVAVSAKFLTPSVSSR